MVPESRTLKSKDTIQSIQVLRGCAASMVVLVHSFVYLNARGIIPDVPQIVDAGRAGVDIFFVISGFIMVCISGDNFAKPGAPIVFLVRRIIRIVPIYWFYTLLMGLLVYMLPHLVSQGKTVSWAHLLASLFFVPWPNNIGQVKPILSAGWTLNFEMYFYLVFSFILFFKKSYFIPTLTSLLLSGVILGYFYQPHSEIFYVITSPLLIEFMMGCVIGVLYKHNLSVNNGVWYSLLLVGATLLILTGVYDVDDWPRVLIWGLPSALIVISSIFLEKCRKVDFPYIFIKMGDSSYSIYLSHIFTISVVGKIWATLLGKFNAAFVIVAFPVSVIVGYISYSVFEKPITNWLNYSYKKILARHPATEKSLNKYSILYPVDPGEKGD